MTSVRVLCLSAALTLLLSSQIVAQAQQLATVTTLAGSPKQAGKADGLGTAARFTRPMGIALAPDGTVYVADTNNHCIRRISPTGEVTMLAGAADAPGSVDGIGASARFVSPLGVALDAQGNLYVADAGDHTIRRVAPTGAVTTLAGTAGHKGRVDGPRVAARFHAPHGIAVASNGTVYVADTENHTIRQLSPAGVVTTWAGLAGQKGAADGNQLAARFFHPTGLAVDTKATVYVVDNGNHTVRLITPAGNVSTLAGKAGKPGSTDGVGSAARFDWPNGIAVDAQGKLYVADNVNSTVRCITPTGQVTTVAGKAHSWGSEDGPAQDARFEFPFGVAVDGAGTVLYITDTKNHCIRCIR